MMYVHAMAAFATLVRYLPAAAAGTIGAGMPFMICADMSQSTVFSNVAHSG